MEDQLDKEVFICMECKGKFSITEGTFPQNDHDGNPIFDAEWCSKPYDWNTRTAEEFVCYDCCG